MVLPKSWLTQFGLLQLRRSKTDQVGDSRKIAVPYGRSVACPVTAMATWLEHAQIHDGAVFRAVDKSGVLRGDRLSAQSVTLIVKECAKTAALNPSALSAHSLRAGLVTSAAQADIPPYKIQQQTGHRSREMLNRYIRDANLFGNNAAAVL